MKNFLKHTILIIVGALTILEITTRVFNLSAVTLPETNLNGNRLLMPNTKGLWIRGGLGEIKSDYRINKQGFNSLKDYDFIDENKITVAIIGDSYIEGFHVDVQNSIGRIIEKSTNNKVEVHEFGHSGGNIVDFSEVFQTWVKNKYDYTFILLTDNDLTDKKASFMGKGDKILKKSTIRNVYDNLYSIRYLNINHGMSVKFSKILTFDNFRINKKEKKVSQEDINENALIPFDSTVVFLHERNRLNLSLLSNRNFKTLKVEHKITPIDCGFDGHWGKNGRINAANSIIDYLNQENVIGNKF